MAKLKSTVLLIMFSFSLMMFSGCVGLNESEAGASASREKSLPVNAVKVNPGSDLFPPVLHSADFDDPIPMPGPVNTAGVEDAPVVTADGSIFIFFFTPDGNLPAETQVQDGVSGVWWCRKNNAGWSEPVRADLGGKNDLHLDGPFAVQANTLWFGSIRQGNYREIDIYTAQLSDEKWTSVQNAGKQLNQEFQVGELYLTADGSQLYFGRVDGGLGQNDLWVSAKEGDSWSAPVNLGSPVNTDGDESRPVISPDGNELWFTRLASGKGYTGPSIFRSTKTAGGWSEPEEVVSNFSGDPGIDGQGNLYFTHLFYGADGKIIEADIYVAYRR